MSRVLVWAAIALAYVDLVFFSGASNYLASPQARILTQVVVGIATIAWLAGSIRAHRAIQSELVAPGLAYAGTVVVSAALRIDVGPIREAGALLLLTLPGYLVVREIVWSEWLGRRFDWLVVVTTTVFVAAYLVQVSAQWIGWWSVVGLGVPPLRPGDVGLTVGTANAVAVYLELLVPVGAWIAWRRWRSATFAAGLLIAGAFALLVTSSRGAWVGTVLGLLLVAVPLLHQWRGGHGSGGQAGRSRIRTAILGGGVVLVALVAVAPLVLPRLMSGDAGRFELWGSAADIFRANMILGGGPGSWPALRAASAISDASYAVLYTPHSSLAVLAVELGLAGLVAGTWLVIGIGRMAWRSIGAAPNADERFQRMLVAGSLLAVGVHSLVDPMWHIPAVVLLTLMLVARLDPPPDADPDPAKSGSTARRRPVVALAVVLAGAAVMVPIDVGMVAGQLGADRLTAGDPEAARDAYSTAILLDDRAPYRVGHAIALSQVGDNAAAISSLQRAADDEPYAFIDASIASLAYARGDTDLAVTKARAVASRGRYDATAAVNAAAVLWRVGDDTGTEGLLAATFLAIPGLLPAAQPPDLFDDGLWDRARDEAISVLGRRSAGEGAYWAIRAGRSSAADRWLAMLADGPERSCLTTLRGAEAGVHTDGDAARSLLMLAPADSIVLACANRIGLISDIAELSADAQTLSIAALFNVPSPDYRIVVDGAADPALIVRLPRWPNASDSRLGPARPYVAGMLTIEGVP